MNESSEKFDTSSSPEQILIATISALGENLQEATEDEDLERIASLKEQIDEKKLELMQLRSDYGSDE